MNYELFLHEWNQHPLFKCQRQRNEVAWKNQNLVRQQQNHEQVSHALIQLGQGQMPDFLPMLESLKNSIQLITGGEDEKYCTIAQTAVSNYPHIKWEIIQNAGHNTHLEQPQQFVKILTQFMN